MQATIVQCSDDIYLWHQLLGYINFTDIRKIPECTEVVKLSLKNNNCICLTCLKVNKPGNHFLVKVPEQPLY